jgi:DNA-directed RNA polymerase beta subunit
MEDAIVVSEDFAKRLTSDHLFGHDMDYKRGIKGGKAHFTGLFVHKYTNDQLAKLDEDGVALPGQTLQPGDPIILATRPRVVFVRLHPVFACLVAAGLSQKTDGCYVTSADQIMREGQTHFAMYLHVVKARPRA